MKWSEEQEKVLSGKGNMLVNASAGSGKTTVMVEKVLRLIKSGVDLRRILMMTFTRASAKEMKEKLVAKACEASRNPDGVNIKKQLNNMPFANIETIDSFCFSIMRKYFNIVGCDPAVGVGEENAMQKVLDECVEHVMEKHFCKEDEEFIISAGYFRKNRSYAPFKEIVLKIIGFASTRSDKEKFYALCKEADRNAISNYYLSHRKLIVPYLIRETNNFIDECKAENYFNNLELYMGATERLNSALGVLTVKEFIAIISGIVLPQKINVKLVKKAIVSEELAQMSERINEILKAFIKKVTDDGETYHKGSSLVQQNLIKRKLVEVCIEAEKEYATYKKRRNVIDIGDATAYAIRILSDDKARDEIKNSFDYIFVDEYQDTNSLQECLIDGIENDNVFSVGDVKQAIYHFRSAEPDIFIKRGEKYLDSSFGTNFYLNTNYRSCEEILEFTNRVCDRVMVKDFCGIDYKNTSRLKYGNIVKSVGNLPAVQIYVDKEKKSPIPFSKGIYSVKNASIVNAKNKESMFLAEKILEFVGRSDIGVGEKQKIGFGDIAVLAHTSSKLKQIADVFTKRGIPFYTLKESVDSCPEREVLVDCLRLALNAEQDIPLFNVASSPLCGITPSEFALMRADCVGKKNKLSLWEAFNSYKGNQVLEKKVKQFVDFILDLGIKSAYKTAEELLNEILSHHYDAYLLGKNADKLAELNAFVSYVGGLSANNSCEEFLAYYDTSFKGNRPPIKENAVALMTMHGSKGLEFPVVFLPFQDAKTKDNTGKIELDGELGLAVKLFSDEDKTTEDSFEAKVIRMKCRDEERQELARLMYVAFTRARNYLIITGKESKVPLNVFDGASVFQWILFTANNDEAISSLIEEMSVSEEEEEETLTVEQHNFDGSKLLIPYAYEQETQMPAKYSVSELLKKQDGYGYNPFEGKGSSAIKGTALHAVMQYIDYSIDNLDEVEQAVDEMMSMGYLTLEERNSVNPADILCILRSDIIEMAKRYPIKREQPFILYTSRKEGESKVLIQGIIDLLIEMPNGYVIVDFKTGGGEEEILKKRYAEQLALYAEGVEKVLKKPVIKKIIYSVSLKKSIQI